MCRCNTSVLTLFNKLFNTLLCIQQGNRLDCDASTDKLGNWIGARIVKRRLKGAARSRREKEERPQKSKTHSVIKFYGYLNC